MNKITFSWNEHKVNRVVSVTTTFNKCSLFEDYNLDY